MTYPYANHIYLYTARVPKLLIDRLVHAGKEFSYNQEQSITIYSSRIRFKPLDTFANRLLATIHIQRLNLQRNQPSGCLILPQNKSKEKQGKDDGSRRRKRLKLEKVEQRQKQKQKQKQKHAKRPRKMQASSLSGVNRTGIATPEGT